MTPTPSELAAQLARVEERVLGGQAQAKERAERTRDDLAEIKVMAVDAAKSSRKVADLVADLRRVQLETKEQVEKTNGRVTRLELWQAKIAGAAIAFGGVRAIAALAVTVTCSSIGVHFLFHH